MFGNFKKSTLRANARQVKENSFYKKILDRIEITKSGCPK